MKRQITYDMKAIRQILVLAITAAASALSANPQIGEPAPDFALHSAAGNQHSLSDFKGKIVVLEWVNHGCPFVKKHYESGNMQRLQAEYTGKDIVWLSICSSAEGKQGYMEPEAALEARNAAGAKATAYLIDETGEVGKLYGARVTPEMYIIDAEGKLVYRGAIDSIRSTDVADVERAHNYVTTAIEQLLEGQPVTVANTKAYGCSIKYAK